MAWRPMDPHRPVKRRAEQDDWMDEDDLLEPDRNQDWDLRFKLRRGYVGRYPKDQRQGSRDFHMGDRFGRDQGHGGRDFDRRGDVGGGGSRGAAHPRPQGDLRSDPKRGGQEEGRARGRKNESCKRF